MSNLDYGSDRCRDIFGTFGFSSSLFLIAGESGRRDTGRVVSFSHGGCTGDAFSNTVYYAIIFLKNESKYHSTETCHCISVCVIQ